MIVINGPTEYRISPVTTVAQYCASFGTSRLMLEPAQTVSVRNDELDVPLTYSSAEIFLTRIADATIVAGWDFVIAPTGEVLRDSGRVDINIRSSLYPMPLISDLKRWRISLTETPFILMKTYFFYQLRPTINSAIG